MTVTILRIYNNNNTRMTVFPYFSSEQLSRIITTINFMIINDTELSVIIEKMQFCLLGFICSYSVLYFTITKQILYVLHLQLNALTSAQKTSYGLTDFSYNIDTDTLSFCFWKQNQKRGGEENRIEIIREEDPNTHLMGLRGKSGDYVFPIDLKKYRIFDIILTVWSYIHGYLQCIQYRQHTLLTDYEAYLDKELLNTHYTLHENRVRDWISELSIHIHSTPIALLLSVNSFTGEFELNVSDPCILHWCENLMIDLKTLMQAQYNVLDKLDQFYIYCVLYQIAHTYSQTSCDYRFVYSFYGLVDY